LIVRDRDLERLEWPAVLEAIRIEARTPMGRERVTRTRPASTLDDARLGLARVEEMRRVHASKGRLPISEVCDPRPLLVELGVAGRVLTGRKIHDLLRLLLVGRETAERFRDLDPETYPALGAEWARFPDLEPVIDIIEGNLTPAGELEDHASPELARIRRERRHSSQRLEGILEGIFQESWTGPVLRDRYVTLRNNRFVVPVRSDTPRRFPGIVHATSATEKTLFVEPLQTVEINNRLVTLRDEEESEVRRILAGYTRALRAEREQVAATSEVLGEADSLEAAAAWAQSSGACHPELEPGAGLKLEAARHPLLERALSLDGQGEGLVPLDVDLSREHHVLVISGPNAGGKTVALKTIGLATLLAHAGLPVPADEARIPHLTMILADIGDDQSLEAGLSTFSSHIRNLAEMISEARPPALVLIDEIGTGTDPAEGSALGTAILERLRSRGVHVVATTHLEALKSWAYRTDGALNAAADFDERTHRPTYRLVTGVAGASIGVTMAEQLGLDAEVVADARRRLDPTGAESAAALESVRALAIDLQRQREEIVRLRREQERRLAERETRLAEREATLKERWAERLERLTREFRAESRKILSTLKRARDRKLLDRERMRHERELKARLRPAAPRPSEELPAPAEWSPGEGDPVRVVSLGREGTVRGLTGDRASVQLGRATFTVALSDLRPADPGAAGVETTGPALPQGVGLSVRHLDVPRTIRLAGLRAEEGLNELDRFLDRACLAGHDEIFVAHGIGTGRLRRAVREMLDDHPEVASWREATPEEGGDGVTVVLLADDA